MTTSVSVVLPTYNAAHFLAEAIDSVRAQEWPDLELIVVDDGSTDNTQEVLSSISLDGEMRVFQQAHGGAAAARNLGIAEARGEWIAFLDADDLWLTGRLAAQFAALFENPEARFSYTDVFLRFEGGEEREHQTQQSDEPLLLRLLGGNLFATPSVLVRRDCLLAVGAFDSNLRTGEDWDLWLRLSAHYECAPIASPLVVCRVSSRPKFDPKVFEVATRRVLRRLFSCPYVAEHWPEVKQKQSLVYAWHYSVLAKSFLRERMVIDFSRLACLALTSHPAGLRFMSGASRDLINGR